MPKVLANVELNGNQLIGMRLEVLAADPTGGGLYSGRMWFNSTTHVIKYYDGSSVVTIGSGAGSITSFTVDGATIENIGTSSDPSIRIKAGGVTDTQVTGPIAFSKLGAPAADFSLNSHKLTNVTDPTAAQDAATKNYVDTFVNGLAPKDTVRLATTANGALATAYANGQTVDGITLVTGDRILVKNQAAPAENGIYVVASSGTPDRSTDADSAAELLGASVFVSEGTVNGNTLWVMTTDGPLTVGTTGLVWSQFGGPGAVTAGAGITVTGQQVALTVPVSIANGGTGGTDAAAARANLGAPGKFAAAIGDGSSTTLTVTHNLNSRDVAVSIYDASTFAEVLADIVHATLNTITVAFSVAPGSNAYRAVVVG